MIRSDLLAQPLITVEQALPLFAGLSERSFRRALEPDGDLADLALRIGRRVFVRTAALSALLGLQAPPPSLAEFDVSEPEFDTMMEHAEPALLTSCPCHVIPGHGTIGTSFTSRSIVSTNRRP